MSKQIEDEVIVSQSIDAIKLKSPRGLFRLSGGHEKRAAALEKARKEAREAELARQAFRWAPGEIVLGPDGETR